MHGAGGEASLELGGACIDLHSMLYPSGRAVAVKGRPHGSGEVCIFSEVSCSLIRFLWFTIRRPSRRIPPGSIHRQISLPVPLEAPANFRTEMLTFDVTDLPLLYNG